MFGRGGGEAHLHRIKVIQHPAIAGQVLAGIAGGQLAFGHFLIQGVTPVGFVDDDAVVGIHGRRGVIHEYPFDHGLYGGHLHAGFRFGGHVAHFGHVINLRQGLVLFQWGFVEGIDGLLAEGIAIYQKENALEAFCFEEAVHEADDGTRFAGASGHGQQGAAAVFFQCAFYRMDRLFLIVAQFQVAERLGFQGLFGLFLAALEQVEQAVRGMEFFQCPFGVAGGAHIPEPGATLFCQLRHIGAAVTGIDEGHVVVRVIIIGPGDGAPCQIEGGH